MALTLIDQEGDLAVRVSYRPMSAKLIAASAFPQRRGDGAQPRGIRDSDPFELAGLVWNAPAVDAVAVGEVHRHPYVWLPEMTSFTPCRLVRRTGEARPGEAPMRAARRAVSAPAMAVELAECEGLSGARLAS